jgi:hypothetical protein
MLGVYPIKDKRMKTMEEFESQDSNHVVRIIHRFQCKDEL